MKTDRVCFVFEPRLTMNDRLFADRDLSKLWNLPWTLNCHNGYDITVLYVIAAASFRFALKPLTAVIRRSGNGFT